jgi:hypothetical protein
MLFLSPGPSGEVVQSGDIDNRIKTVFDARMPASEVELGEDTLPGSRRTFRCPKMVHCSKFVVLFQKFASFFIGNNTTHLRLS